MDDKHNKVLGERLINLLEQWANNNIWGSTVGRKLLQDDSDANNVVNLLDALTKLYLLLEDEEYYDLLIDCMKIATENGVNAYSNSFFRQSKRQFWTIGNQAEETIANIAGLSALKRDISEYVVKRLWDYSDNHFSNDIEREVFFKDTSSRFKDNEQDNETEDMGTEGEC